LRRSYSSEPVNARPGPAESQSQHRQHSQEQHGKGAESYYLQAVASGVEDYYLGSGEAPGRWLGAGAARLGLSGVVAADDLRSVLDGRDPATGRSLIAVRRPDRLPGLDLTFSAPKSVSLLFALCDDQAAAVRRAHDAALAQTLS
jgi:conjugative relaxase-like TrwC/TraI family protein